MDQVLDDSAEQSRSVCALSPLTKLIDDNEGASSRVSKCESSPVSVRVERGERRPSERDLLEVNHERRRSLVRPSEYEQSEEKLKIPTRVMDSRVEILVMIRSVNPMMAASTGMNDPGADAQTH
jgi:hypothetical protein